MELATRKIIRQSFSAFPSGNENELITKQDLIDGTGGLLTVGSEWGTNECISASAIVPSRAYFCKSDIDMSPIDRLEMSRSQGTRLYLSKEYSSLKILRFTFGGITYETPTDIPVGAQKIPFFAYGQFINNGNYWVLSSETAASITVITTYLIDGVEISIGIKTIT